jgi:LuxR family maltose regulon positive regulatory protein
MKETSEDLAIRARLTLPRPRRYLLRRPALFSQLLEARHYRLTVVQASTGYGKSTAVAAALQEAPLELFWYTIGESDRDPRLFLLHLVYAFRLRWPEVGERSLAILRDAGPEQRPYQAVINALSNDLISREPGPRPAVLVLDDYHLVNQSAVITGITDHFIEILPPRLHLIIATRQRPDLEHITSWRVGGELLEITQRELAFSGSEIEALFRTQYGVALTRAQVERLVTETEGWVIALQMIWQSLQSGVAGGLDQILAELPHSLEELFTYLAQEVLARRPAEIQEFLVHTSILQQLDPAACDFLLDRRDSREILRDLEEESFFVVRLGDSYRYHHLFHDLLRQEVSAHPGRAAALHQRAARYYQSRQDPEQAIYHWLAAAHRAAPGLEEYHAAAELIGQASERLIQEGRLDTVSEWITRLAPPVLADYPRLMMQMGDICRFTSRFEEAIAWYEQAQERYRAQRDVAGASRALRGQAAIYLDTVRPIKAESLLQEALKLVDGQADREDRARLLELMAENMTNQGKWEEAENLREQARQLREKGPSQTHLDVRVLLRTGRLDQACLALEQRAGAERRALQETRFREPRSHREALLLLSLIYAWQGQVSEAIGCAREGIQIGQQLGSPFVEAVGYMRLGHGWQIALHLDRSETRRRATACYEKAIEIGDQIQVERTKVEALWGLCRLHGFAGEVASAERAAHEGIELGLAAGDDWIVALITVALGASYVIADMAELAERWLERAKIAFREVGDTFGQTVACLWECLFLQDHNPEGLAPAVERLLDLVGEHNYRFLFHRPTFFGPPDPARLVPLLLAAGSEEGRQSVAGEILEGLGLARDLLFHPGYSLHVQTLGRFAITRGDQMILADEWHRDKARSLFQLLLVNQGRFLTREEIAAVLWPEADETAAEGQFKVTLNALHKVLEPDRPARAPTLFVQRRGSSYGLNLQAPLYVDNIFFEELIAQGDRATDEPAAAIEAYSQATRLYRGDLMPDAIYDDWSRPERERLRRLYLTTATRLAELLVAEDDPAQAAGVCEEVLRHDACWEAAYQVLIEAHLQQGDRVAALRVYERCTQALRDELGVEPTPQTLALHSQILG